VKEIKMIEKKIYRGIDAKILQYEENAIDLCHNEIDIKEIIENNLIKKPTNHNCIMINIEKDEERYHSTIEQLKKIKVDHFNGFESVYSGHFHLRQKKENVTYIGNCFPHNFADAGDSARGMMVKEWGMEDKYFSWPGQPLYRVLKLSEAIDNGANIFQPNMLVRVELDIGISYEEATFIKETFVDTYNLRELTLLPVKNADIGTDIMLGNIQFESIDSIVTSQLTNIASDHYDPNLLLDIYRHL
jgi:hypothetical protein